LHQCAAAAAERGPVAFVGPAGSGKLWWTRALHAKLAKPPPLAVFEPAALTVELQARFLFGDAESGLAGVLEPDRPLWLAVRQPTNLALDLQAKLVAAATAREDRLRLLVCERDSLESALRDGRLDPKLYYFATRRRIEVPPLVERREDLQDFCLIWHRLRSSNPHSGLEIDAKALAALASYHWPGNVRELFAVLDAARSRRPIGPISADDLVLRIVRRRTANPEPPTAPISLQAVLERVERRLLETALAQFGGNKSKAAEHLGLSRAKLLRRLEQLLGHKPGGAGDGENPDGKVDLKD
jgi:sigma-54-specific transcriptional regulator